MKCRNCGKKNLDNIQAVRAHLRFCPNRPDRRDDREPVEHGMRRQREPDKASHPDRRRELSSDKGWPPVPYEAIPLVDNPGAAELEDVALNLGIRPRVARTVSNYLSYNVDLDDPLWVWRELEGWPELSPAERHRWLRTWCSLRGIDLKLWHLTAMGWG